MVQSYRQDARPPKKLTKVLPERSSTEQRIVPQSKERFQSHLTAKHLEVSNAIQSLRPHGGRIKLFLSNWEKITSDKFILSLMMGCKIEFTQLMPFQLRKPRPTIRSTHSVSMENQIRDFLERGIIKVSDHEEGEWANSGVAKHHGSLVTQ